MLSFPLFMALKYLKPKRTWLSVISIISVIGVLLGVAVLVIVLSVMSGFDDMWRDKILGFDAHVTVTRLGVMEDEALLAEAISALPGVAGVAPSVQGLIFVQHGGIVQTPVMRGVDLARESQVSQLPRYLVAGKFALDEDQVLIGRELARRLNLTVGDKLLVYSPQSFVAGRDEISLPLEMQVAGIFEIGMWEYDVGFLLMRLERAQEIYALENGIHALRVMTADPFRAQDVAARIVARLAGDYPDLRAQTWMDLNRQLFTALRVEKNMMFFLLIFIVLVAAFGITNTLIIVVVQKTREIGLLKALGFASGSIMRIFFWQGFIQGFCGTVLGILLGFVMLRYRNDLMHGLAALSGLELFPKELYHLSEIPARTAPGDIALIAVLALAISTLAGLLPAWRAARLDPAQALRYE
ncbi:MAG: FtsX-like permease family protein [Lentisphaerae bacterium]|nr:FtsX-like permease family protein [Lentisphaerota bacterium]